MTVQFELPNNIESALCGGSADLNQLAKESVLVELFRQDKISRHELSQALGLSRMETDELLKNHHVTEDLLTCEDYHVALAGLREKISA
jgi:predicted HTH domain antitoxin